MDQEMTKKIDAVLERVKEPESGLSMAELGLVSRLRYSDKLKKLAVFTSPLKPSRKHCCTVIQGLLIKGTLERLTEEFKKEFPDLTIELA
jgi:metal-sulfur cluster biosynthetic enzyme